MQGTLMTRLSSKGQLVIPHAVREQLGWTAGLELEIVVTEHGVLIQPHAKPTKRKPEGLRGFVRYQGAPLSDEELCAPVTLDDGAGEA